MESLFNVGDRVAFTGEGGGIGTVVSVRETPVGPHYRVTWDDDADAPEMGEDELVHAPCVAVLNALREMARRLGLWHDDGPEIAEEWSARLDLPLDQAHAVVAVLAGGDAAPQPCPDCDDGLTEGGYICTRCGGDAVSEENP